MKTVKLFFGLLILVLFSINSNAQAAYNTGVKVQGKDAYETGVKTQENTMFRTTNSIELKGSSDVRQINVEVNEDGSHFDLDVSGQIQTGSMKIEIFDPKGKRRGSFSTGTILNEEAFVSGKSENDPKKSKYEERVNGRIMQQNATSGTWIIKITPKNAHGRLNFRSQQSSGK